MEGEWSQNDNEYASPPCRGEGWHWLCFTSDPSIIRAHISVVTTLWSPGPFKSKASNVLLLVIGNIPDLSISCSFLLLCPNFL